jgi:nucleoside 2-deoxyribosyltransferase
MTSQYRCEHRIYLAGSWKNQQEILLLRDVLKSQGHTVDCFASEDNGRISFNWSKLDDIQDKLPEMDAKDMLSVPRVQEAFREDRRWLDWCDMCILILPSGKSAHLEAGYAKGQGKTVVIFGDLQKGDFDVMYGFADGIFRCDEIDHMVDFVSGCASHSDFQSEREKVLEQLNDLRRYANGEYKEADLSDNEHDLRTHLEYENRIWGIMQELRKGGVP